MRWRGPTVNHRLVTLSSRIRKARVLIALKRDDRRAFIRVLKARFAAPKVVSVSSVGDSDSSSCLDDLPGLILEYRRSMEIHLLNAAGHLVTRSFEDMLVPKVDQTPSRILRIWTLDGTFLERFNVVVNADSWLSTGSVCYFRSISHEGFPWRRKIQSLEFGTWESSFPLPTLAPKPRKYLHRILKFWNSHPAQNYPSNREILLDESAVGGYQFPSVRFSRARIDEQGLSIAALNHPDAFTQLLQVLPLEGVAAYLSDALSEVWQIDNHVDRWEFLSNCLTGSQYRTGYCTVPLLADYRLLEASESGDARQFPTPVHHGALTTFEVDKDEVVRTYAPNTYNLLNCSISNGSDLVDECGLRIVDPGSDPRMERSEEVWGSTFSSNNHMNSALIRFSSRRGQFCESGIFLGGRHDWNWYHCFTEYIPSLVAIERVIDSEVPIIVSTRMPKTAVQVLRLISSRRIVSIEPSRTVSFGELFVTTPSATILDYYHAKETSTLFMNDRAQRAFVAQLRQHLSPNNLTPGRRVFVVRNSAHRGLLNQAEVVRTCQKAGLEIVDIAEYSFSEQLALFSSCQLVVSASGAVMSNYAMMPPGSHAIALTSTANRDSCLPALIAQGANVNFTYVVGQPFRPLSESTSFHAWRHTAFTTPIDALKLLLHQTID